MPYAEDTRVPVAKSRAEIEATVAKYGAEMFASMIHPKGAVVTFEIEGRRVRFALPLPEKSAFRTEVQVYHRAGERKEKVVELAPHLAERKWEQACRQRWRALALCIKAKLEAVDAKITTIEKEFLAHIVLPGDNGTVGEWMRPQLEQAYTHGCMPPLLPGVSGSGE